MIHVNLSPHQISGVHSPNESNYHQRRSLEFDGSLALLSLLAIIWSVTVEMYFFLSRAINSYKLTPDHVRLSSVKTRLNHFGRAFLEQTMQMSPHH